MADPNIKRVIIPEGDLYNMVIKNDQVQYLVRYRIISEDKTRTSEWSPIYHLSAGTVAEKFGDTEIQVHMSISGGNVNVVWDNIPDFTGYSIDIYVEYSNDPGEYLYSGTASGNSYSFLEPESPVTVTDIALQVSTTVKTYNPAAQIPTVMV